MSHEWMQHKLSLENWNLTYKLLKGSISELTWKEWENVLKLIHYCVNFDNLGCLQKYDLTYVVPPSLTAHLIIIDKINEIYLCIVNYMYICSDIIKLYIIQKNLLKNFLIIIFEQPFTT
jgi:hypothetical protein